MYTHDTVARRQRRRGAILLGTLLFILIASILLLGVGTMCTSHQQVAQYDLRYAQALDLAEAGVNKELNKISKDYKTADQSPGTAVALNGGTYTTYVVERNSDGSDGGAWSYPDNCYIYSTGTIGGVSRTVKVSAKGYNVMNNYTLFAMNSGNLTGNITINGNAGTNGSLTVGSSSTISGGVDLAGAGATESGGSVTTRRLPEPLNWQTVDQIAYQYYPNSGSTAPGGLAYLATHNSNALASPALNPIGTSAYVSGSQTLYGLSGNTPTDYYVAKIDESGNKAITFDNTLGAINLWVGPDGASTVLNFAGTTKATTTGYYPVNIFIATATSLNLVGNATLYANIYCYNKDSLGNPYGTITDSGTPTIYGNVLANTVTMNGTATITLNAPTGVGGYTGYYGKDNSWQEQNLRY